MLVHDPVKQKNIVVSRVYGPTQSRDKESFWNSLVQMNNVIDIPWCLIGDCNELKNLLEKRGKFDLC